MKKILVTGCAGFIGSTLSSRLLQEGYHVFGIDNFTANYDRWIKERNLVPLLQHPNFSFQELDLLTADWNALLRKVNIVFHLAALPGARKSCTRPFQPYADHNIALTHALLDAAKNSSIERIIHASSASVYGQMTGPIDETHPLAPLSPYGATKAAAEHLGHVYAQSHGVPLVILRYFSLFGPRQRPDMALHTFIYRILLGLPIPIYGDGKQSRDFTFIQDAHLANLEALHTPYLGETFNISGGTRMFLLDVIKIIETLTGNKVRLQHLPPEPGEPKHSWADISKARQLLHYNPHFDFEKGLYLQILDIRSLYKI
jgi:UDP-glucuronate 4-epimerase